MRFEFSLSIPAGRPLRGRSSNQLNALSRPPYPLLVFLGLMACHLKTQLQILTQIRFFEGNDASLQGSPSMRFVATNRGGFNRAACHAGVTRLIALSLVCYLNALMLCILQKLRP